jgi:hypothetical protein
MIHLLLQAGGAESKLDIVSLIVHASGVAKGTLVLLALMSIVSWFVIGTKWLYLARAYKRSVNFVELFWRTQRLDDVWKATENDPPSPVSEVFRAGFVELAKLRKRRTEAGGDASAPETHIGDIESIERDPWPARAPWRSPKWRTRFPSWPPPPAPRPSSASSARCGAS